MIAERSSLQVVEVATPWNDNCAMALTTRMLTPDTWEDFAALVEANNGVWGGCWCMGFHAGGSTGLRERKRDAKQQLVTNGAARQVLVYDGDRCVGWCQFGTPPQLPNIKTVESTMRGPRIHRTGGPGASSRTRRTAARGSRRPRWPLLCKRSGAPAAAPSRHTRNRLLSGRRSGAPTGTPDGGPVRAIRVYPRATHRQVAVGDARRPLMQTRYDAC